jgi:DNA-binding winged helix-turn-helix (wHTH) protein
MPDRRQFGLFDFDPASGVLCREGIPVKLQAQPARVLRLLIANSGEVVSRETLRRAVWGADTLVHFDRGLNLCIAQIRAAPGESAESPRFSRTVPKKGYQFVAPISQGNCGGQRCHLRGDLGIEHLAYSATNSGGGRTLR